MMKGGSGEAWARELLKRWGCKVFQVDWMVLHPAGHYLLVEVKEQERFLAPPFDGHGLPPWQIETRLAFQYMTGVRAMLMVREPSGRAFWQWLDVLAGGKHYDTNGASPRRIFPLEMFEILCSQ